MVLFDLLVSVLTIVRIFYDRGLMDDTIRWLAVGVPLLILISLISHGIWGLTIIPIYVGIKPTKELIEYYLKTYDQ